MYNDRDRLATILAPERDRDHIGPHMTADYRTDIAINEHEILVGLHEHVFEAGDILRAIGIASEHHAAFAVRFTVSLEVLDERLHALLATARNAHESERTIEPEPEQRLRIELRSCKRDRAWDAPHRDASFQGRSP